MVPTWLHVLAIVSLLMSIGCALLVLADISAGRRQKMGIMNVVWPLTPLYLGPLGLLAYFAFGRGGGNSASTLEGHHDGGQKGELPFWQSTFTGTTHCGAGCTLGDFIGEWAVFLFGWKIAGIALWPEFIADFTVAYVLGVVFQYFSIVPMRHLAPLEGIWAAIKADTLSIAAFEIGMFAWMAFMHFFLFKEPLYPTQAAYWFMMQIAMIIGFATSYPMNWCLIRWGLKEKM